MRYIVQKSPHVSGPLVPDDEPCIVIRGQDILAVAALDHYLKIYRTMPHNDPKVIEELMIHRDRLRQWQEDNPTKLADR